MNLFGHFARNRSVYSLDLTEIPEGGDVAGTGCVSHAFGPKVPLQVFCSEWHFGDISGATIVLANSADDAVPVYIEKLVIDGTDYQPTYERAGTKAVDDGRIEIVSADGGLIHLPPGFVKVIRLSSHSGDGLLSALAEGVERGEFMPHDRVVAMGIASVLCVNDGSETDVPEEVLYERERAAFVRLAQTPETQARIEHLLGGKGTLRN